MSETISNIKIDGTTYAISDESKATVESVEGLINTENENTTLLNNAHTKLDELLSKIESEGLDTSDATATAATILSGQTAYVNGIKVVGTLDLSNLLPENIVSGVVINGIEGIHVCTSTEESLSDLVALGILTKQISEFTDADIGTSVFIPYTDASGNITGPIEFEVVGVNHHKDVSDESKPTITLMSKNILRYAAFDGKEPSNPDVNRSSCGNERWSVSNIRQWLNSEGAANEWWQPNYNGNQYDTEPNTTNTSYNASGAYSDDPGFLAGFSDEIKQHFATVRNKTILCDDDKTLLSKDFEETEDKAFLPSYTEMGFGDLNGISEGSHISKFNSNNSRIKSGANSQYWMRTPWYKSSSEVYRVMSNRHRRLLHRLQRCHRRDRTAFSFMLTSTELICNNP